MVVDKIKKNLLYNLNNNEITKEKADEIKLKPLGDDDINNFYNSKIILNSDIEKYNNIDEILPNNPDYVIILFRSSKNQGHWVLLSKYDNKIEYFDSYGYHISYPINWINDDIKKELNEYDFLTDLLKKSNYKIIVNKYEFQDRNDLNIATCGRWCLIRALTIMKKKLSLNDFTKIMKYIKNKSKLSYDNIISDILHLEGGQNNNNIIGNGIFNLLDQLNIDKNIYLKMAKQNAKKNGYNSKLLNFSNNKNKKLNYDGVNFGSSKNKDFIIYSILVKKKEITKDEALKHRNKYLSRATKIKGNWKDNKISPNNLAINILW
jgi:hypothetical protein